jgi:cobaltochelatase CobN
MMPGLARAQQPLRIAYIFSDGNSSGTLRAYRALVKEAPELGGRLRMTLLTESVYDEVLKKDLLKADVLVFDMMNQQLLDRFNAEHKCDVLAEVSKRGRVFLVGQGVLPKEHYIQMGIKWDDKIGGYWQGGFSNQLNMMKYALREGAGLSQLKVGEPEPTLGEGYYYPAEDGGKVFKAWDEFAAWHQAQGHTLQGKPWIAVGFYKAAYYGGETGVLDAVIRAIEKRGMNALPVFGYPDGEPFARLLTSQGGKPRADAALALSFRFADFEAGKALEKLGIPVINLVSLYGRSEKDWRGSKTGLSTFEGTFQVAVPELAGLTAPTVVGSSEVVKDQDTGLMVSRQCPILERIDRAVDRAARFSALRRKANFDKHIAIFYYNFPPGKANLGASYLNVAGSIASILKRMRAEGYDLGAAPPDSEALLERLLKTGRNVGGYAAGELAEMVEHGGATLVPLEQYQAWLAGKDERFREKVEKDWGDPAKAGLMFYQGKMVVPVVMLGKVALLPQPARGSGENAEKLYHATDLAPHHQYVGAYAWVRDGFKADAVVHVGTHGTLEWLDGKDIGLDDSDAPEALISDLPDAYIYNVDVVGEGLVARRRGAAVLVDHMIPPIRPGGLYNELAALSEAISDYDEALHKSGQMTAAHADEIREKVEALGIAKDLGTDLSKPGSLTHPMVHKIMHYMDELKKDNIPYGLHTFGVVPGPERRRTTVQAILRTDRSALGRKDSLTAEEMDARIVASGPRELDSLMKALSGRFVPTGGGNDPTRNPDAYPTGANIYGIDPDKVPKRAAWALGVKLADQMLADHKAKTGHYPQKVSFVIWGDETMRSEGVLESQIFYLLGTRPVWDARDKVVDVEVIPSAQLGRPRVDIVIACAAAGMFSNVTHLMDKAVQEVKSLQEAENFVRDHYLAERRTLISRGYSEKEAEARAGVRIFDEPPGTYELGTSTMVGASGGWDKDKAIADDYFRKMGHGYGNGFWGEPMEDVFRLALSGTEKVVHSSSTVLYGAVDNDDFFMYAGGLAMAVRNLDGKTPDMVVANTRNPAKPEMTSINKFVGEEFKSRYVNPEWIKGMQKEGYAGAGEMRSFVENLWGWQVTVPDVVGAQKWQEVFEVYVQDKDGLKMKEFFEKKSPFAYQDMASRMLETIRKGYWSPSQAVKDRLAKEVVASARAHGLGCSQFTCGNPRFAKYAMDAARAAGVPAPEVAEFKAKFESATRSDMEEGAAKDEAFAKATERGVEKRAKAVEAGPSLKEQVQGYMMEKVEKAKQTAKQLQKQAREGGWDWLVWLTPIPLALLFWVFWRRRRALGD